MSQHINQMELSTIVDHNQLYEVKPNTLLSEGLHKPAGVRLAKMLNSYEKSPSSQLWGDIQWLAREILK